MVGVELITSPNRQTFFATPTVSSRSRMPVTCTPLTKLMMFSESVRDAARR